MAFARRPFNDAKAMRFRLEHVGVFKAVVALAR